MNGMQLFAALGEVQDDYILESALPPNEAALHPSQARRRGHILSRRTRAADGHLGQRVPDGWGVALICILVSLGAVLAMVQAGRNTSSAPPIGTEPSVTHPPDTHDTAPITEGVTVDPLVYVSHGDGTCSVKASASLGTEAVHAHLVIPAMSPSGDTVTAVADYGFLWASSLKSVTLPATVTAIGTWAFAECESLEAIALPEDLSAIGTAAFLGCSALTNVNLPAGVESLGDSVFSSCTSLCRVTVPGTITTLPSWAFYNCTALTEVHLTAGLNTVGYCAFYGCTSLVSLTLPDTVAEIGNGALANCTSLASMVLPVGVRTVGDLAFDGCTALATLTVHGLHLTAAGANILRGCTSLSHVRYGSSAGRWAELGIVLPNGCTLTEFVK